MSTAVHIAAFGIALATFPVDRARHVDTCLGMRRESTEKAAKSKRNWHPPGVYDQTPRSVGFWMTSKAAVDRMCSERHESNQPPNRLYKET
jgi:hypothetical protein